jgi:hypothetical protein
MQIKTTLRFHLILIIRIKTNKNVGEDVWEKLPLCTVAGDGNQCSYYGNQHGGASKN